MSRATIRNSDPRFDDRPRRLGRAGLAALMDDPRYWDGDHPDHDQVVDTVRRGFEIVFAPPKNPELSTVPINGDVPVTDPDGPFARHFARLLADNDDLDILPESARRRLGRQVILASLDEEKETPADKKSDDAVGDPDRPWHPVDADGNEIPPHPDDPRFNADGSPKPEWYRGDTARIWNGRNSRYDPETGEFEYYTDLPDYHRDPDTGRWTKKGKTEDTESEKTSPDIGAISFPPTPPLGEGPKTRRGRQALGR